MGQPDILLCYIAIIIGSKIWDLNKLMNGAINFRFASKKINNSLPLLMKDPRLKLNVNTTTC
jgi:hypothetical protein